MREIPRIRKYTNGFVNYHGKFYSVRRTNEWRFYEGSVRSILNSGIKISSNFPSDNYYSSKFINNFVFMKKDRTDSYFFSSETRENALLELSRKRESVESLAPMLWHSFGTISGIDFQILRCTDQDRVWLPARINMIWPISYGRRVLD